MGCSIFMQILEPILGTKLPFLLRYMPLNNTCEFLIYVFVTIPATRRTTVTEIDINLVNFSMQHIYSLLRLHNIFIVRLVFGDDLLYFFDLKPRKYSL